jgi:hypothetical protein
MKTLENSNETRATCGFLPVGEIRDVSKPVRAEPVEALSRVFTGPSTGSGRTGLGALRAAATGSKPSFNERLT